MSYVDPVRDDLSDELKRLQHAHAARGGRIERIAAFGSVDAFDRHVGFLKERFQTGRNIEDRALVMDSPPGLSPLIAGSHYASLGREARSHGEIADGVEFQDPAGIAFVNRIFEEIWTDSAAYRIATPAGLDLTGVGDARGHLIARA